MRFRRRYRGTRGHGKTGTEWLGRGILTLLILCIVCLLTKASQYLKQLAGEIALSDASDLMTMTINDTVFRHLQEDSCDDCAFVSFQTGNEGNITAVTANMAEINAFASEVLQEVVMASNHGDLDIRIPLGNLLGLNLMLGKGPDIPVDIIMLTSSRAGFRSELSAAGINQTKHEIILEMTVDIDVLIPWGTMSTQVVCDTLIAETVIIGGVPETFVNME